MILFFFFSSSLLRKAGARWRVAAAGCWRSRSLALATPRTAFRSALRHLFKA